MTDFIGGLGEIAARYDVLLSDVWGVVHDGETAFAEACATLTRWREARGPVILVSNSPRPGLDVIAQLDALGVPRRSWSAVVTSGDATRALLAARAPGPVWKIGPERDAPLYAGLGLIDAGVDDAAFIACSGLVDDEAELPEDYRVVLTRAANRGLTMICANPDKLVQRGDRLIPCAGALAELYDALGGEVLMAGKPHPPIYGAAIAAADTALGRPADRRRLLVVGDGVATDIAGANAQGLDALFIGGGIHGATAVTRDGGLDRQSAARTLLEGGVEARYAMAGLAWEGSRLTSTTG